MNSYRWGLLGKLSIEPVSEALKQCVPASDNDTAIQALRAERSSEPAGNYFSLPPHYSWTLSLSPRPRPHRTNVDVTHANAGGDHMAHT